MIIRVIRSLFVFPSKLPLKSRMVVGVSVVILTVVCGGCGAIEPAAGRGALLITSSFITPDRARLTFQVFTDPHPVMSGGTIGFTYAGNKFVGSVQGDGFGILYATDLDGRNVRAFAPSVSVPAGNPESEHFIASSLGLGGFPKWGLYVAAGNGVLHISNDGNHSDMFVGSLASAVRSILFDPVGTFGYDMLLTTVEGQVYRVSSSGAATLLASIAENTEGMDIAPLGTGFGAFDGQVITVSESSGLLRAISPSGQITILNANNPIPGAERVSFVPLNLGASGSIMEGLYEANFRSNVLKVDANQFVSYKGDAIVTTELLDSRISRMHWNGAGFDISIIGTFPNQAEDGIFLTPFMLGLSNDCRSHKTLSDDDDDDDDRCTPGCKEPEKQNNNHSRQHSLRSFSKN